VIGNGRVEASPIEALDVLRFVLEGEIDQASLLSSPGTFQIMD
jgi:hypothetical protein